MPKDKKSKKDKQQRSETKPILPFAQSPTQEFENYVLDLKIKQYFEDGSKYQDKGEFNKSIIEFTKAIKALKKITSQDENILINLSSAYNNRGTAYLGVQNYNEALTDFDEALQFNPKELVVIYLNRGIAYSCKKNYDNALNDFNKAIEIFNEEMSKNNYSLITLSRIYSNKSLVNYYKKNYNLALDDCNKAIELSKDNVDAYNNKGMIYTNIKEYDIAINNYNISINILSEMIQNNTQNDEMMTTVLSKTYNNRGIAYYYKKEYENAINDYTEAINLRDNEAYGYNSRGCVYVKIKKYSNAMSDYNEAIRLFKNNNVYLNNRVLLYVQHSKLDKSDRNIVAKDIVNIFNIIIDKNVDNDLMMLYTWKYFNSIYNEQYKEFILKMFNIIHLLQVDDIDINKYTSQKTFDKMFNKEDDKKNGFGKLKINIASSMNDTNEGKIIFEYLTGDKHNDELYNKTNGVFISSFTENPSDTIGMWNSQYGDNCKGISYTFDMGENKIKNSRSETNAILSLTDNNFKAITNNSLPYIDGELQYCRVAYYNSKENAEYKFSVFKFNDKTQTVELQKELSEEISKLFVSIKYDFNELNKYEHNKKFLQDSLIMLSHLVKSITYYHENEIRLINVIFNKDKEQYKDKISHHEGSHIAYFDTGHTIDVKKVTLSPYLSKDPKYKDFYQYLFDDVIGIDKVKIETSEHPYNL